MILMLGLYLWISVRAIQDQKGLPLVRFRWAGVGSGSPVAPRRAAGWRPPARGPAPHPPAWPLTLHVA